MNNISSLLFISPALLWSIAVYQMSAAKAAHWSHLWWAVCLPQDLCQCCSEGCWTFYFPYRIWAFLFRFQWQHLNLPHNGSRTGLKFLPGHVWFWCVVIYFAGLHNFITANCARLLALPGHGLCVWVPEMISSAVLSWILTALVWLYSLHNTLCSIDRGVLFCSSLILLGEL